MPRRPVAPTLAFPASTGTTAVPLEAIQAWENRFVPGVLQQGEAAMTTVQRLLGLGVPVDTAVMGGGRTALVVLLERRPPAWDLVQLLLDHGADADRLVGHGTLAEPVWATIVRAAHRDSLTTLLDRGLDVTRTLPRGSGNRLNLLDLAILGLPPHTNQRQTVDRETEVLAAWDLLAPYGFDPLRADPDQDRPGTTQQTSLKKALQRGFFRVAQRLVDGGMDPHRAYPFTVALSPGGARTGYLVDHGTLVHQVAASGSVRALRWLVETQGLDPLARSDQGLSALEIAQRRRFEDTALVAYLERRTLQDVVASAFAQPRSSTAEDGESPSTARRRARL